MAIIQLRRGTASAWTTANPTLGAAELGAETDTHKVKVGDGTTAWTSLAYLGTVDDLTDLGITATATELNYVDGVTAAIQTQIDGKQPLDADLTALAALSAPATKLSGIAAGATVNDTDANLKNRANHTGTQAPSTVAFAATARLLGRATAGAGAGEEITLGTNLSLSGTTLNATGGSGGGDASTNTATSVDGEVALFSGTGGKTVKRATGTGLAKLTAGVLGTATAGTDYVAPGGTDIPITDGGTGVSTLPTGILKGAGTSPIAAAVAGTDYYAPTGTDVAVADGGTGASTAANARTNLGLVIGTNVQAWDADLDTWATKTAPTGAVVGTTDAQTLPNKRITPRVGSAASSATPTINTDNVDIYGLTALAADITSFTTNLSGTPTDGQPLWIYIVGTATRAITWGASFENGAQALPAATVGTARLDVAFVWNAATSKWRCMGSTSLANRVTTITSSATPTINTDLCDAVTITALAAAITSMTTNLTGTPTNFQKLMIRIKDNGTARAISWGTSFEDGTVALPTTTVAGKTLLVGMVYDAVDAKWACEASGSRA